ncbi:DUF3108 domain-containing protein [Chloracidobacterium aggregatum]|uniref:DUF3108 domain-containing protein n=1 Tax=Chloracidobacterium sp. N TaxID=2821540 RepID=A0ABX8B3Z0_9BACT|nr:DUF3108 domain-containing protein [Chloracidobacterium aggregatum]QUV95694.1 DUF3108 domain-containing protein [Chloracidobacterium sp. N]QUV98118.1 DUF3108 domain-containing protein [Chloracidobacterium sp. E]
MRFPLKLRLCCLWVLLFPGLPGLSAEVAWGQTPTAPVSDTAPALAGKPTVAPPFPIQPPFPFAVGEKLTYEFSFSRFPLSGKLGELVLSVVSADEAQSARTALVTQIKPETDLCPLPAPLSGLAFHAQARTRGFLPALLRVDVRNEYLSVVESADLGLLYNQRTLRERERQRLQMTCQARTDGKRVVLEQSGEGAVNTRTLPARGWTTDLQTFWYVLRTHPLTPGAVIPMVLTEDDRIYDLPVVVTPEVARIQTSAGTFRARKLELKAYESGFTRYKGSFLLWVSEDAARLPVRVQFKARGVTVTGELVGYTLLRPELRPERRR